MRSLIDDYFEGIGWAMIIMLPLLPIMLLYGYFVQKYESRKRAMLGAQCF